jgi:hypothetical protein
MGDYVNRRFAVSFLVSVNKLVSISVYFAVFLSQFKYLTVLLSLALKVR